MLLPKTIFSNFGGIGDSLFLTTVAKEMRKGGERHCAIVTRWPELFFGNPDVSFLLSSGGKYHRLAKAIIRVETNLSYHEINGKIPCKHILRMVCDKAGIEKPIEIRPYFFLNEQELKDGSIARNKLVIQASGLSASSPMLAKEYFPQFFRIAVKELGKKFEIIQIGSWIDPLMPGVLDLRGRTSIRQLAAVLQNCKCFIGTVGFPMHLARAVDCPSVIVYGGRETPSQSGYICNANLIGQAECSPCWHYTCPQDRECMKTIPPRQIVNSVEMMLDKFSSLELPVELI